MAKSHRAIDGSHRLLDQTLVYTAVTRAQKQVLIVGNATAAKAAVESPPRVQARQVALDLLLNTAYVRRLNHKVQMVI